MDQCIYISQKNKKQTQYINHFPALQQCHLSKSKDNLHILVPSVIFSLSLSKTFVLNSCTIPLVLLIFSHLKVFHLSLSFVYLFSSVHSRFFASYRNLETDHCVVSLNDDNKYMCHTSPTQNSVAYGPCYSIHYL